MNGSNWLKSITFLIALFLVGWFCNFAYTKIEKSQIFDLKKENERLAQELGGANEKIKYLEGDLQKKMAILLVMFPNNKDQVKELFKTANPDDAKNDPAAKSSETAKSEEPAKENTNGENQ